MTRLAVLGGPPAVKEPLKAFRTIGAEEKALVQDVLDRGLLSGFYGSWSHEFWGGPMVRRLEGDWKAQFGCRHAVSVNSATSGLIAAMGAVGVGPGDEVIVPPYTMSATAMAPLIYGGIPVFADIDEDTFCIDPQRVTAAITPRTKAIIAVNLFGHPARLAELREMADRRGIKLIEDNAQAILAKEKERWAGTIGHIGVFSLNVHKHIQAGEGGVCVTDDDGLALRLQAIRNHAENVVEDAGISDLANMVGFNFRLTELSAAVGVAQLAKIGPIMERRIEIAQRLTKAFTGLPGITVPAVRDGCLHVYYAWSIRVNTERLGISRDVFVKAISAEGMPLHAAYVKPLYRLPLFRRRIAMGGAGFPFTLSDRTYEEGLCPVAEKMHDRELVAYEICAYDPTNAQIDQMIDGVHKVLEQRHSLSNLIAASSDP